VIEVVGDSGRTVWTGSIVFVAAVLLFWAVAELLGLRLDRPGPLLSTGAPITTEVTSSGPIALHRLLPDASNDLGRLVTLDGTVVGDPSRSGFWVKDLRDNVVFVSGESGADLAEVEAGSVVRVLGVIVRLTADEQAEYLGTAGLVVPASALIVRDVKVAALAGGIEVLGS